MKRTVLLETAREIAEEYADSGYDLTLRQLYYQCVARGFIPNSQLSYKRLGDTLGTARLNGSFPMHLLVDRGREAGKSQQHSANLNANIALSRAGDAMRRMPSWLIEADRWIGQPNYVSVWVEKDALSGVFKEPCDELGVGFFACKGYPSHSALWQWIKGAEAAKFYSEYRVVDELGVSGAITEPISACHILYFGDHDPDGWQIPRSAEDSIQQLVAAHHLRLPRVEFHRIALNMEQIEEWNPPPFPAKETSSRFNGYVEEHGVEDAWELDALRPDVLDNLIRTSVLDLFDHEILQSWQEWVEASRARLVKKITAPAWLEGVFK
jgi:hypothetical protein